MKGSSTFIIYTFSLFILTLCISCQPSQPKTYHLVPYPTSLTPEQGSMKLPDQLIILNNPQIASFQEQVFADLSGYFTNIIFTDNPEQAHLIFYWAKKSELDVGEEGYELIIGDNNIQISATSNTGLFYGFQTLRQLLIQQANSKYLAKVSIKDEPHYEWRGSMLDISRRFMSMDYLKKHIDRMAAFKLNRLHLHLTDDQGWRIQIIRWPKLTEIGSQSACDDGKQGFLSQREYRELQQYARNRQITIIPEIDMPGHIYAAIRSYPELLLCKDTSNLSPQKALPPEPYTGVEVGWSKLCLNDPEAYRFVREVLGELSNLTLGEYIHIGGDEIEDERYQEFVERVDSMVRSYGKIMIGWEEIAKGNIHSSSIVQQWHGKVPVQNEQPKIYSLCNHLYLDHANFPGQEKTNNWCKKDGVDLKDVYELSIDPNQNTLGIEAPIWTEYINEGAQADNMLWPRLLALSERSWNETIRPYEAFIESTKQQIPLLKQLDIQYYEHPDLN